MKKINTHFTFHERSWLYVLYRFLAGVVPVLEEVDLHRLHWVIQSKRRQATKFKNLDSLDNLSRTSDANKTKIWTMQTDFVMFSIARDSFFFFFSFIRTLYRYIWIYLWVWVIMWEILKVETPIITSFHFSLLCAVASSFLLMRIQRRYSDEH